MADATTTVRLKIIDLVDKGKKAIWNLNLFQSIPPTQDDLILRKQRFSTRLFLLLFLFCLLIFTIHTSQVYVVQFVTVDNLSYSLYTQLFTEYPHTLNCPCTRIAIPNKEFLQLNVSYHEVCSSIFVGQEWIHVLLNSQIIYAPSIEFRHTGALIFQILASLCGLAKHWIDDELLTFDDAPFISANIMSADLFMEQSLASIDLLISNVENSFMRSLSLIRLTTTVDGLVSGFLTKVAYKIMPFDQVVFQAAPFPHTFPDNCTCFGTTTCTTRAFLTSDG